jgi:hypothetical protein
VHPYGSAVLIPTFHPRSCSAIPATNTSAWRGKISSSLDGSTTDAARVDSACHCRVVRKDCRRRRVVRRKGAGPHLRVVRRIGAGSHLRVVR